MHCTESYLICSDKSVKHVSPSAKVFCGIFVEISQHQKWYIFYVPRKRKIVSLYNVVFDESLSSALVYTSQLYVEAMAMQLAVSYIPYATSPRGKTGNLITCAHFDEGSLLSETCNKMESGNEYEDNSNLPPFISE